MTNVALVGFGYGGETIHAPLIASVPALNLHTIVTSQPDKARSAWPGARIVATVADALNDPEVDLVVVVTPNDLHAPLAEQALVAGKHVVVDKPFTVTAAEARRLCELAEDTGLLLSVFQSRRFDSDFLAVRKIIETGRLGEVGHFESRLNRYRPVVRDRWRERPGPGAGVWYDLGSHLIDQALTLFGSPIGITADIASQRNAQRAPDYFHAILRYQRLRVVLHADVLTAAHDERFAVHGDRGSFLKSGIDPQEAALLAGDRPGDPGWGVDPRPGVFVDGRDGSREVFVGEAGDYRRYYQGVADALRGFGPNPVRPTDAIIVMEIIEAGILSNEVRAEIQLGGGCPTTIILSAERQLS